MEADGSGSVEAADPVSKPKVPLKRWDVYWSPEGRKIETVEAKTATAAIRKVSRARRWPSAEMYAVPEGETPK